jgi:hypothetical protein
MSCRPLVLALLFAACAHGSNPGEDIPADARVTPIDAKPGAPDAPEVDAAPGAPDAKPGAPDAKPTPDGAPDATVDAMPAPDATPVVVNSLLISEVVLAPTGGEFIEIYNPTAATVALDHYYLSDHGTYWKLPAGGQVLDTGDFIAKFPVGAMIASHAVVTVALDTTANFTTAYGAAPTYSIASGTMLTVDSTGTPGLTNGGEPAILFSWDGASDLVTDVDMMLAGAPSSTNLLVSKSGATQDGPDAGTTKSTYAVDANTLAAQPTAPASGKSTKRILLDTGHQTANGTGNGVNGDDCTSEDTSVTWDSSAYTAPTPGTVPTTLMP